MRVKSWEVHDLAMGVADAKAAILRGEKVVPLVLTTEYRDFQAMLRRMEQDELDYEAMKSALGAHGSN